MTVVRKVLTCAVLLAIIATSLLEGRGAPPAGINPGRPSVHRLNRVEYANAVRDLLDVRIDAEALLPPDESMQGFDNIGGVLAMSPVLLDRYLSTAHRIARLAVGDPSIGPAFGSQTYEAPQTVYQNARLGEEFAFGTRGGLAVRHRFPLDGEYVLTIRLRRNIFGYTRGLGESHQLDVRVDGQHLTTFTVGDNVPPDPAPLSFTGVLRGSPAWEAYSLTADSRLQIRCPVVAGDHLVAIAFVDDDVEEEGVLQPPLTGLGFSFDESRTAPTGAWGPAVDAVSVEGP